MYIPELVLSLKGQLYSNTQGLYTGFSSHDKKPRWDASSSTCSDAAALLLPLLLLLPTANSTEAFNAFLRSVSLHCC